MRFKNQEWMEGGIEMLFEQKTICLKNGKECIFRSPSAEDAAGMAEHLKRCAAETPFVLRYPEECVETPEQEASFLTGINESENGMMIVCIVDGGIAGTCQISFHDRIKLRHRAGVAIGIIRKYWNLGIGTAMFREMIGAARKRGVTQLELEFIQGNTRARALYEKMGFQIVSVKPNAIRLKDGTMLKEYFMVKEMGKNS